jgi:hypothetical protein
MLNTVVPLEAERKVTQRLFTNRTFQVVDDDHPLHKTANEINWKSILD